MTLTTEQNNELFKQCLEMIEEGYTLEGIAKKLNKNINTLSHFLCREYTSYSKLRKISRDGSSLDSIYEYYKQEPESEPEVAPEPVKSENETELFREEISELWIAVHQIQELLDSKGIKPVKKFSLWG